jgi:hypothetical protein
MRTIPGMLVFSAFCCLAGCTTQPPPDPEADFGGWIWNYKDLNPEVGDVGVSATWGSWNKKFVFLILTDSDTSATTVINAAGSRTEYKVDLELRNRQKDELRVVTPDGITGSLVHGEQSYDLAQGSVFLLLPEGGKLKVLQLKRDLADVPAGVGSVTKLLRTDQEIGRIFAKVK